MTTGRVRQRPGDCPHRGIEQVSVTFTGETGFLGVYWCPRCGALGARDEKLAKKKPGTLRWRMPAQKGDAR